MFTQWNSFKPGKWQESIDVRDFIQKNYTPYEGDDSFLTPATERTEKLLHKFENLLSLEREFEVFWISTHRLSLLF